MFQSSGELVHPLPPRASFHGEWHQRAYDAAPHRAWYVFCLGKRVVTSIENANRIVPVEANGGQQNPCAKETACEL